MEPIYHTHKNAEVVLIDHSPGEDRHLRLAQWANSKAIIVCHDAQPKPNAGDYRYETVVHLFKYVVRYQPQKTEIDWPTGAMACSNEHDLTKWIGKEFDGICITSY